MLILISLLIDFYPSNSINPKTHVIYESAA